MANQVDISKTFRLKKPRIFRVEKNRITQKATKLNYQNPIEPNLGKYQVVDIT